MNTFDEILNSILKAVEEDPSGNIDAVIASKISEFGLSEDGRARLDETNRYLVAYDEMYSRLLAAKKDGATRDEWLQKEVLCIADKHGLSDVQKEKLFDDLSKQCECALCSTIEKGE